MLPPDAERDEPPDWGEVFTFMVTKTNISFWEVSNLTLPQLTAVMARAGKYMDMGWGMTAPMQGGSNAQGNESGRTVEDTQSFVSLFQGIG